MNSQESTKPSKKRRRPHYPGGSDEDNEIISVYSDRSNDGGNLSSNASTPESAKIGKNENEALSTRKRAAHDIDNNNNNKSDADAEYEKYFTTYRTVQVPKGISEGQLFHVLIQHTSSNITTQDDDVIGVKCPKGVKAGDTILLVEPGSSPPLSPPQIAQINEQRLLKGIGTDNAKWVAISFWKIVWPKLVEEGWWCRKESLFNFGAVTIYSPTFNKKKQMSNNYMLNRDYYESILAVLKCDEISPSLMHKCYADAEKRKSKAAEDAKANNSSNAAAAPGRRNYSALDRWKYPNGITALKHSRVGGGYHAHNLPEAGTFSKGDNNGGVILEPLVNLPEQDKVNPTWLGWANDETFANDYHLKILETKKEFRPLAAVLNKPIGFCLWYYYSRYKVSDKYVILKNLLREDGNNGGGEHLDECVICNDGGDLICCDSCPNAYHLSCLGLTTIDDEKEWFCPDCTEEKTRCLSPRKFAPSPSKELKLAVGGEVSAAATLAMQSTAE